MPPKKIFFGSQKKNRKIKWPKYGLTPHLAAKGVGGTPYFKNSEAKRKKGGRKKREKRREKGGGKRRKKRLYIKPLEKSEVDQVTARGAASSEAIKKSYAGPEKIDQRLSQMTFCKQKID